MATFKKINDPISVIIDTEPEQPSLQDSSWEVKLVDLTTNTFTDISNDVTVNELMDNTISDYSSIPSASSTALAGTRIVNVQNASEIQDSDFVTIGSSPVVYKIVSKSITAGSGYIKLHKDLEVNVNSGDEIHRVNNTGSYVFNYSIPNVGRYAFIITNRDSEPNIDLLSQSVEIVLHNLEDIYDQNDDILTAVGTSTDNSKVII